MNLKKQINNLYIEYLNSKYDNKKLKDLDIDIKKYKINNKYKGVQKFRNDKYRVQITINNKIYSLGVFDNMEIAAKKYAIINEKINNQNIKGGKVKMNSGNIKKNTKNKKISKSLKTYRSKLKKYKNNSRKCKSLKRYIKK